MAGVNKYNKSRLKFHLHVLGLIFIIAVEIYCLYWVFKLILWVR